MVFGLEKRITRLRRTLLPYVHSGTPTVVAFQRACGLYVINPTPVDPNIPKHLQYAGTQERAAEHTQSTLSPHPTHDDGDGDADSADPDKAIATPVSSIGIGNRFLYYWFTFAAALGNEFFYITVFPFIFWCVNFTVARRTVSGWTVIYFVGQFVKDLLRLPRPPTPPVLRLERHYETEYGLPSTHAMAALYTPCMAVYSAYEIGFLTDSNHLTIALVVCAVWLVSVCLSRLYMGVHTVADLIAGLILGFIVLTSLIIVGAEVDRFQTADPNAQWVVPLAALIGVFLYPRPSRWTNAFGDTSLILATGTGVVGGQSVYFGTFTALPLAVSSIPFDVARMLVGCAILFLTRAVLKKVGFAILTPLFRPRNAPASWDPARTYITEIPCKLLVYGMVGFNAVALCPRVFRWIGI